VLLDETNIKYINCESDHTPAYGFQFDGGRFNKAINCTARNYGWEGFNTFTNDRSSNPTYDHQASAPKDFEFINCTAIGDGTIHSSNQPIGFLIGGGNGRVLGGVSAGNVLGAWVAFIGGAVELSHIRFANNIAHHIFATLNTAPLQVSHIMEDTTTDDYTDTATQGVSGYLWDSATIIRR
jgi:hypothetical protein